MSMYDLRYPLADAEMARPATLPVLGPDIGSPT